jgi:putative flippase GtrA
MKALPIKRLSRYGAVGILATILHTSVLVALVRLAMLQTGLANLLAFVVAFVFSASAQQAFTFNDRLAGQTLKKRSLAILFAVNCLMAYVLGSLVRGPWIIFLALGPPFINYGLFYFFSGHPRFKR